MERVRGTLEKPGDVMEVEASCRFGLAMKHHTPASDPDRHINRTEKGITEHARPEPHALVSRVDSKARDERDRLRIPARALSHSRRTVLMPDLGHPPCIEAGDDVRPGNLDDMDRSPTGGL